MVEASEADQPTTHETAMTCGCVSAWEGANLIVRLSAARIVQKSMRCSLACSSAHCIGSNAEAFGLLLPVKYDQHRPVIFMK